MEGPSSQFPWSSNSLCLAWQWYLILAKGSSASPCSSPLQVWHAAFASVHDSILQFIKSRIKITPQNQVTQSSLCQWLPVLSNLHLCPNSKHQWCLYNFFFTSWIKMSARIKTKNSVQDSGTNCPFLIHFIFGVLILHHSVFLLNLLHGIKSNVTEKPVKSTLSSSFKIIP